jgi:hypothetical protein
MSTANWNLVTECADKLIGVHALQEFCERFAEAENFSELIGGQIGGSEFCRGAFSTDFELLQ